MFEAINNIKWMEKFQLFCIFKYIAYLLGILAPLDIKHLPLNSFSDSILKCLRQTLIKAPF